MLNCEADETTFYDGATTGDLVRAFLTTKSALKKCAYHESEFKAFISAL